MNTFSWEPQRSAALSALLPFLLLAIAVPLSAQVLPVRQIDHDGVKKLVHAGGAKATLVNLWATWCIPCREEMPALVALREKYAGAGLNLVLVSADGPAAADSLIPAALGKAGVTFQTYVDIDSTDEELINGINPDWSGALPASFLYDSSGTFVKMLVGGKSYKEFEQSLLPLLR